MNYKTSMYIFNNMIRNLMAIFIISGLLLVSACEKNDDDARNENSYNVFFIMPKGERTYIGTVRGISSCKYAASSYYSHRLWIGKDWDYVCCLRTPQSRCSEEHKYEEE